MINKIWLRVKSLSIHLKALSIISFISILLIKGWLIYIPAPFNFLYIIGDFYLQICYASFATSIYFFFIQHLPVENKKIKSSRFIANRVTKIYSEIIEIFKNIGLKEVIEAGEKVTYKQFEDYCKKLHPMKSVYDFKSSTSFFEDWYEYLNFKSIKIKGQVTDLMKISELLEEESLEMLLNIHDIFDQLIFNDRTKFSNENLELYAYSLYEAYCFSNLANESTYKQLNKYRLEYNKRFIEIHRFHDEIK